MCYVIFTFIPNAINFKTVSHRNRNVKSMFIAARMSDNKAGESWYYKQLQNIALLYKH